MTVAKIVHFLKWIDKHETLCLNCSNEEIADQYLATHPAQAGGMPGEWPTDEDGRGSSNLNKIEKYGSLYMY